MIVFHTRTFRTARTFITTTIHLSLSFFHFYAIVQTEKELFMAKTRLIKCGTARRPKKKSRLKNVVPEECHQKKLMKAFEDITDRKGRISEERFHKIFRSGKFQKPKWFAGIRKATRREDHREGTDFFILTKNCGEIRFDVKSSFFEYRKQRDAQESLSIFVWAIVVAPNMSDEEIRRETLCRCEIHIARLKREVRLGHYFARTA
jgi:hypothetical protein